MSPSLTAVTAAAAAALTLGLIAAPAVAVAAPAPAGAEVIGTSPTLTSTAPTADADPLLSWRSREDGVKGRIKNFSGHPVEITFNGDQKRVLADRDEVTYYAGQYALVTMSHPGGGHQVQLQLIDHVWKQPISKFWPDVTDFHTTTERRGWVEQESHHELWGETKLWLKREKDGWNGGHETSSTSDWAVFTVHIDGLQK